MSKFNFAATATALALLVYSDAAFAGDWIVSQISGRGYLVRTMTDAPERASEGQSLPTGVTFATGRKSRAVITDGKTVMVMGPETNISITEKGPMSTVRQASGSIGLEVETLGQPHLTVATPFLAAVVKGTNFSVTVGADSAEVAVTDGVVGVTEKKTGKRADVKAGQSASTDARGLSVGKSAASSAAAASLSAQAAEAKATADPGKSATGNAGQAANSDNAGSKSNNNAAGSGNNGKGAGASGNSGNGKGAGNSSGNNGKGGASGGNNGNRGNSGKGSGASGSSGNGGGASGGGSGSSGGGNGKGKGKGKGKGSGKK